MLERGNRGGELGNVLLIQYCLNTATAKAFDMMSKRTCHASSCQALVEVPFQTSRLVTQEDRGVDYHIIAQLMKRKIHLVTVCSWLQGRICPIF